MARLLTISSFVARGHVGNSATSFPLQRLGHEVVALPTVILAHHPGHARNAARAVTPDLAAIGRDALLSPAPHPVDGVLVGYLAEAGQAREAAGLISETRALEDNVPVLLDPICGDGGMLYVDQRIVGGLRELLPLADIATPNVTELAALAAPKRLAEATGWDERQIVAVARRLGPPTVVVTSVMAEAGRAANIVVTADRAWRIETPRIEVSVHGTGDLLAGLILAGIVSSASAVEAAMRGAAAVHDILARTAALGRDELALAEAQEVLAGPSAAAVVQEI